MNEQGLISVNNNSRSQALVLLLLSAYCVMCTTQLPKRCLQLWVNYNQLTYSVCFVIDLFFGVLCLFFTRSVLPESIFYAFLVCLLLVILGFIVQ